ncbi:glycosyltransferase [Streptomyces sp. NPDC051452]|uniref:glycosyltransferase n=1 Tax=Streptomyces sp. NPDC051452 TaxID=3365654 RepID=UPI0037918D04
MGGDAGLWCDRLVRGLEQHEFEIYALGRDRHREEEGPVPLPPQVRRVRTAPLWMPAEDGSGYGRRARRRFAEYYGELAGAVCAGADAEPGPGSDDLADRFASALYGLAELAREQGGLVGALRSDTAVRALERACRAPGALRTAREARVPDLLTVAAHLERALRPLSLDWYDDDGLAAADLCHAAAGGPTALPGLLARHLCGVPLLVTEYGVQLRSHYLTLGAGADTPAVRTLLAAFHGRLATEIYRRAEILTPGNAHARRWQERCGADRGRIRTVYPGLEADRFAEAGEAPDRSDPDTLVWLGRVEPAKDLVSLLHAFAEVHREEPKARLRIVGSHAGPEGETYLRHCRALAAQLFPDEAEGAHAVGDNPVSFEEIGGPEAPTLSDAYAAGAVVVLSSVVEGFPISLIEAMLCARATVSTDVGAVVEVIGGTGLVVPPRNPRALAEACVALLRDPERRARLGAAARARALELFTVEQNIAAFHGIYLEIVSHCPVRRVVLDEAGELLPFAAPAESQVPGHWTGPTARVLPRSTPGWATGATVRATVRATPLAAAEGA